MIKTEHILVVGKPNHMAAVILDNNDNKADVEKILVNAFEGLRNDYLRDLAQLRASYKSQFDMLLENIATVRAGRN